jgi:hypothetical protein
MGTLMITKNVVSTLLLLLLGTFTVTACDGNGDSDAGGAGGAGNNNNGAGAGTDAGNANSRPVVRAPQPKPIDAVFTQASYTTEYTVEIENPDGDEITVAWSGPTCGAWFPENKVFSEAKGTSKLTWNHVSPPCPEHAHHDDATINMFAVGKRSGRTVQCIYKGAASGKGPECFQPAFGGSDIGPDTNQVHLRYRMPVGKQCSRVELIQVVSVMKKGPPDRLVIPHNDGMDESEGNLLGYQVPAVEDDAEGYVVDKFFYKDITNPDPYYMGAVPGTPTSDATLDDRPDNTRDGMKAIFETCAFCSGNPTDAEYGKYLDCITWEHDAESGHAQKTEPQPTEKPTAGFRAAVAKWNQNKGFTMPAK